MNTFGIQPLSEIFSVPMDTQLAQLVLPILEVYPAHPSSGGSRQQIRVKIAGSGIVNVFLFDQINSVAMAYQGGVLRATANPDAKRAIAWERSKADRPSSGMGAFVIRKQAAVELMTAAQASHSRIDLGFVVAVPAARPAAAYRGGSPNGQNATPRPVAVVPGGCEATHGAASDALQESMRFAECMKAARAALGNDASADDVRATAEFTYERLYGARALPLRATG